MFALDQNQAQIYSLPQAALNDLPPSPSKNKRQPHWFGGSSVGAHAGSKIHRFNFSSMASFAQACRQAGVDKGSSMGGSPDWWGGDSMSTLFQKCHAGETRHVQQAQSLMDQLQCELQMPQMHPHYQVFGSNPCVPTFLSGEIECMRYMAPDPSLSQPIRIYYDPTSSAVISAQDLTQRGIAVLALAMALSTFRPIELWTFSDIDAFGKDLSLITVKLNTSPLSLSECCFALCNPGYSRGLTYTFAEKKLKFSGMWGFGDYCQEGPDAGIARAELMRQSLHASPLDLIIPGAQYQDELMKQPVSWVQRHLNHYMALSEIQ